MDPVAQPGQPSSTMNLFVRFYSWFVFLLESLLLIKTFWTSLFENIFSIFVSRPRKKVQGEIVLVTGGASGIGKELCLKFGRLGAKVICWDISKERCDEVVNEICARGGHAWGWALDVSDREAILSAAQEIRSSIGDVSILVNNAGIMLCRRFLTSNHKDIRRVMEINVLSQFWMLEAFFTRMRDMNRGHVVAMSSVAGQCGAANLVPYCASKFAVRGIMDALEMEIKYYGYKGIKLTTVFPFIVDTGLIQNPNIRFPKIFKIYKPEQAAQVIVDGIREELSHIWVPAHIQIFKYIINLLPRNAAVAFIELLGNLCDPNERSGWRDTIVRGQLTL